MSRYQKVISRCYVYVATDGEIVKVGSTMYPRQRLSNLRCAMKRNLRMVKTWCIEAPLLTRNHGMVVEGAIHEQLGRRGWCGRETYTLPLEEVVAKADAVVADILATWRRLHIAALGGPAPSISRLRYLRESVQQRRAS